MNESNRASISIPRPATGSIDLSRLIGTIDELASSAQYGIPPDAIRNRPAHIVADLQASSLPASSALFLLLIDRRCGRLFDDVGRLAVIFSKRLRRIDWAKIAPCRAYFRSYPLSSLR